MEGESLWLGRARGGARLAMFLFTAIAVILVGYLIISANFLGGEIGMNEAVRPSGRPFVSAMLLAIAAALVAAGIYFSDVRGGIEIEPTGPFDFISLVCARIAMIAIVFIQLIMFYEVFTRNAFSSGTWWANEASLWIAAFLFLMAGLYAMQQRSHIRIYVIFDLMPRWMQKAADSLSVLLIWVFMICVVWGGYNDAKKRFLTGEGFGTAWDPPLPATVKPAILIFIIMVAFQALSNLIADWNKTGELHSPMDDVDEKEIENIRRTLSQEDR